MQSGGQGKSAGIEMDGVAKAIPMNGQKKIFRVGC